MTRLASGSRTTRRYREVAQTATAWPKHLLSFFNHLWMGRNFVCGLSLGAVLFSLIGCSGGGQTGGHASTPNPTPSTPTTVTITLGPPSLPAAVQTGAGPFTPVSQQNGQISFTVPAGLSRYTVAYICQRGGGEAPQFTEEFIIEATIQDGVSLSADCFGDLGLQPRPAPPQLASATGNVDTSIFSS